MDSLVRPLSLHQASLAARGEARWPVETMKQIPLTHGQLALVDDADFPALSKWEWRAYHSRDAWYAYRWPDDGSHTRIPMHRQLLNVTGKTKVVFLDGNSLNLQRESQCWMSASNRRPNT